MSELRGCSDGNCIVKKPEGQHTNGGCGCEKELRRALGAEASRFIQALREGRDAIGALSEESGERDRYRAALEDLAAFLPGYGDVAEVAAEKCRRALYPLPETLK